MLGKLLKYEMKAMGRIMLPVYLVMIFISGLFAVNLRMTVSGPVKTLLEKVAIFTGFLFGAAVLAVFVVMLIMVVQRFYRNLLGNEGYLMFALPATTMELILSKAITALVWIAAGIAAGVLSGFLMVGILSSIPEFLKEISRIWNRLIGSEGLQARIILFAVLMIVGIFESLCKVYAAIAVGHQFSGHRLLGSVGAYIAFGIVEMVISLPFMQENGAFGIIGGFVVRVADNLPNGSMLWAIAVALIGIGIYGGIAWVLLDRRLNLE